MVTGNIDSETLIKKLTKTGKHAELWPEKADSKKKKQSKSENKEKQSDPESSEENNQNNESEQEKVKVVAEGDNPNKNSEGCATCKSGVQFQEPKPEMKQTVTVLAGNPPPEKKVSIAGNEKSGGGGGGKKKKKKGQKGNNNGNNNGGDHAAGDTPANQTQFIIQGHGPVPIPNSANQSPPRHHIYHKYPTHYYAAPVYTVSYHTGYPSVCNAAFHTSPGISYPGVVDTEIEPPLYDSESYTSQPSDTFELFSDENPNGCAVV